MPNSENKPYILNLVTQSKKGNRKAQQELYKHFYGYGMTISIRYAKNREAAEEIVNDGFVKMFRNLHKFNPNYSFRAWLRRIMINAAIDHHRRNKKHQHTIDIAHAQHVTSDITGLDNVALQDILKLVQELAPSYRMVFNLYAIEGYKHREIAEQLGITEGTSKSNLAIARHKLQKMLVALGHRQKKGRVYGR